MSYPLHLEKTAERLYLTEFHRITDPIQKKVIQWIKINIPEEKNDSSETDTAQMESARTDSKEVVRSDSPQSLLDLLMEMRREYGQYVPPDIFRSRIAANVHLIDAHAKALVNRAIVKINGKDTVRGLLSKDMVQTKTGLKPSVGGVNMISGSITEEFTRQAIKQNVNLIGKLSDKYTDAVDEVLRKGFIASKSQKELIADILNATNVTEGTARFWAQDQAGNFFSEINQKRSQAAGFPGYIWRDQNDGHVRDTHHRLTGTYHRWDDPPDVPAKAGGPIRKFHPGQDWRCRCWAESATGEHEAERKYEDPLPFALSKVPEYESLTDFVPAKTIEDARDYAKKIGVQIPKYKYKKDLYIANYVNEVLTEYKSSGSPMPSEVIIDSRVFKKLEQDGSSIPAAFQRPIPGVSGARIYLNSRHYFPDLLTRQEIAYKRKWHSSGHRFHIVRHEMGHFLHNKKIENDLYADIKDRRVTKAHIEIMSRVSLYATSDYLEFVAELHAGLMDKKTYDSEIINLYIELGGIIT